MTYKQTIQLLNSDAGAYRDMLGNKIRVLHQDTMRLEKGLSETTLPDWLADIVWGDPIRGLIGEYKKVKFWHDQLCQTKEGAVRVMRWETQIEGAKRRPIREVCETLLGMERGKSQIKNKYLCLFHAEKTPSFTIYPKNNSWYCFSCGAGGDVIDLVKKAQNLSFKEAVKLLAPEGS